MLEESVRSGMRLESGGRVIKKIFVSNICRLINFLRSVTDEIPHCKVIQQNQKETNHYLLMHSEAVRALMKAREK
ncbi:hypothetical protein E2C01_004128 [Portunus trituberculatus]|uniref:Uncharacterized protein n=1 Tax=Portunus trituberculatus TaxID=210409 RepID=A0A5B7CP30_PORTR|nr:hypothetical protein [Portunus trituberculatus]